MRFRSNQPRRQRGANAKAEFIVWTVMLAAVILSIFVPFAFAQEPAKSQSNPLYNRVYGQADYNPKIIKKPDDVALIDARIQNDVTIQQVTVPIYNYAQVDAAQPPIDPRVTQDNIGQTICVPNWTRIIRPSTVATNKIKWKALKAIGLGVDQMPYYKLDHQIPLALGGERIRGDNLLLRRLDVASRRKDALERRLQLMVCRGEITLNDAQLCIWDSWEQCDKDHPRKSE